MCPSDDAQGNALDFALDRAGEVPLGVQLAWALRSRIQDGRYPPGQRLPGMRELADELAINVNTVRAVMERLERYGLIERRQGTGTFVADAPPPASAAGAIAASAAAHARTAGVDPREVASALYVGELDAAGSGGAQHRRLLLRSQITVLEQALGELQARFPGLAQEPSHTVAEPAPRLLSVEELEQAKAELVRRLASLQQAVDELTAKQSGEGQEPRRAPARGRAPRRKTAPAAAPAGA